MYSNNYPFFVLYFFQLFYAGFLPKELNKIFIIYIYIFIVGLQVTNPQFFYLWIYTYFTLNFDGYFCCVYNSRLAGSLFQYLKTITFF